MIEGYDTKTLDRINEDNLWDFCLQLGRYGEVCRGDDVKWAYTGGSALNRIFDVRFSSAEADERISRLLEIFAERGVPVAWITGPSTTPGDMRERLEARGYNYIPWAGMAMDLKDLSDDLLFPEGFAVTEITDVSLIEGFADVLSRGFGWNAAIHGNVRRLLEKMGVGNSMPWKHYLGLLDGKPASTCTVCDSFGALGVYFVATAPEARRRGLGLATTWYALAKGRDMGHRISILQASPMGKPVYEKLGFETHCDMALFLPPDY